MKRMIIEFIIRSDLNLTEEELKFVANKTGQFYVELAEVLAEMKKPKIPPTFIIPNQQHLI